MKKYSLPVLFFLASCSVEEPVSMPEKDHEAASFARMLCDASPGLEQVSEVYRAVGSSCANGYDEEYLLRDLFNNPGAGIGDGPTKSMPETENPLREMLDGTGLDDSDLQIYWPYSDSWDGESLPVITYDPGSGDTNEGWLPDGTKVLVSEQMARERPVWVVNRNSDAGFTSLEMLRRQDPSWGQGGGEIVVRSSESDISTLVLHSFKANRQYDCWFAGGSEFFVKTGALEDFTASTDAEMRLYEPAITDFMIVVKRDQVGVDIPFNAVLISEWTSWLYNCAFMISEDDGGTRSSWKCTALVRYNSKSYGVEIDLPINSRDDIVWRGSLSRSFIEKYSGKVCRFGDVELVLELV